MVHLIQELHEQQHIECLTLAIARLHFCSLIRDPLLTILRTRTRLDSRWPRARWLSCLKTRLSPSQVKLGARDANTALANRH